MSAPFGRRVLQGEGHADDDATRVPRRAWRGRQRAVGSGLRRTGAIVTDQRADRATGLIQKDPRAMSEVVPILIQHTTVKDTSLFQKAIPAHPWTWGWCSKPSSRWDARILARRTRSVARTPRVSQVRRIDCHVHYHPSAVGEGFERYLAATANQTNFRAPAYRGLGVLTETMGPE
jgi:hypothetical protein